MTLSAEMIRLSPWMATGEFSYPIWAQYVNAHPEQYPKREPTPGGTACRYALVRNTTSPEVPEGWPTERGEVLAEAIGVHGCVPDAIEALWWPTCGFSVHCTTFELEPVKRLSEETKQKMRRKALARRIEKAAPLFAAEIVEARLAEQPDYFGGAV